MAFEGIEHDIQETREQAVRTIKETAGVCIGFAIGTFTGQEVLSRFLPEGDMADAIHEGFGKMGALAIGAVAAAGSIAAGRDYLHAKMLERQHSKAETQA